MYALRKTADELTAAIDRDASSYDAVMAAFKMPQGNDEEKAAREAAVQAATKGASERPMEVATKGASLGEGLGTLGGNPAASKKAKPPGGAPNGRAGGDGALAERGVHPGGVDA